MIFNKNRSALCALVLAIALACTACSPTKEDVSKYTQEKNTKKLFDVLQWADSKSNDEPKKAHELAIASIDALVALNQDSANKTLIDKAESSRYGDLILQKYAKAHGDFLVAKCQEILKLDNKEYEISKLIRFHDIYYEADPDTVDSIFVSKYMTILAAIDLDGKYNDSQADSKLEICYQSFGNDAQRLKSLIKEFKFYSEGTSFSKAIKDQEARCADANEKITAKNKRRQEIPLQVRALQATVDKAVQREYMARGIQSALRLQEEYTKKLISLSEEFWNIDNDLAYLRRSRDEEVQKLEDIINKRKSAGAKLAFIGNKLSDPYGFISALNNNDKSFVVDGKLNKEGKASPAEVLRSQF